MRVRDWGIGSCFFWNSYFFLKQFFISYWTNFFCFFWSNFLSVIEPVVVVVISFYFTEPISFVYWNIFISYKKPEKTALRSLLYYEVSMKDLYYILLFVEFWSYLSWKNCWDILPVVEKSKMSLIFKRQKFPFRRQICPAGCFWKISFFRQS